MNNLIYHPFLKENNYIAQKQENPYNYSYLDYIKEKKPITINIEDSIEPVKIDPLYSFPSFGDSYRDTLYTPIQKNKDQNEQLTSTSITGQGKVYSSQEKELFKKDLFNGYYNSLLKTGIDDNRAKEFAKRMTAQAALESNWGQSTLSKIYNFGGVKDFRKDSNAAIANTKEFINGQMKQVKQPFRKFNNIQEFTDYKVSMSIIQTALKQDPKNYYRSIQSGPKKYATDPNYVSKMEKMYRSMWK